MHKYLGMRLDYSGQVKVKIDMTEYLKKILDDLPDKYQGEAITLAENNLFEENETARNISNRDAQAFHTIVVKLLFLCKQVRPDIITGVDFLTTRAREPGKDDKNKLGHTLKYLISTRNLLLTLESNGTGMVKWWVDAAFAVYHKIKSHNGRIMTMGRGDLYSDSYKQKLNTKSSTGA